MNWFSEFLDRAVAVFGSEKRAEKNQSCFDCGPSSCFSTLPFPIEDTASNGPVFRLSKVSNAMSQRGGLFKIFLWPEPIDKTKGNWRGHGRKRW